jgi:hypothetical protein
MTVDNCPKEFRVNKDYENAVVAAFEAKYGNTDVVPAWAGADARKNEFRKTSSTRGPLH